MNNLHSQTRGRLSWYASCGRIFRTLTALTYILCGSIMAQSGSYTVKFDTSALSGTLAQLAFDIVDGDGISNNSLTIQDLIGNGSWGGDSRTGGVTGFWPGTVSIRDSDFFNEWAQVTTLGTTLSFTLEFSNNYSGGSTPDGFAFFILNDTATSSLVSTYLLDDAVLAADYSGHATFNLIASAVTNPPSFFSSMVMNIPEPSSWALFLACGGMIAMRRWHSKLARENTVRYWKRQ